MLKRIEAVPGRKPLRLIRPGWSIWLEWRPKLQVWDAMRVERLGYNRMVPRLVVRTDDLIEAVAYLLRESKPC